jgi:hypothetical protein
LVFVRSRRPTVVLAGVTALVTALFGAATAWAALRVSLAAAVLLLVPATFGVGFVIRATLRLRRWPAARMGFFRDRLVVLHRRTELRAGWDDIDLVTLAEPNEWTAAQWPEVRLTERLTIHLRGDRPFSVRPKSFGLDPVACRDLVLRLRDDEAARERLPEFDSILDLARRPIAAGELMKPRF